jgi:hypothetical protein
MNYGDTFERTILKILSNGVSLIGGLRILVSSRLSLVLSLTPPIFFCSIVQSFGCNSHLIMVI